MSTNLIDTNRVFYNIDGALKRFMVQLQENVFYIDTHVATWLDVPDYFREEHQILCEHQGGGRFRLFYNPYKEGSQNTLEKKNKDILFDINEIVG